jgi:hypothetical protein
MRRVHWLSLGMLTGCALQDFQKVSEGQFKCPGLPEPVGQYQNPTCVECVRKNCCDAVSDCQADSTCAGGLAVPLTPVANLPDSPLLDGALACLQKSCDDECSISFGCEGTGYASAPPRNAEGLYTGSFHFTNFGRAALSSSINVSSCLTAAGFCLAGKDDPAPNADGTLDLQVRRADAPYFGVSDPSYSPDTAAEQLTHEPPHVLGWSEPIPLLGKRVNVELFNTGAVQFLVEKAAKAQWQPDSAHAVFYLHNCLPLKYFAQPNPPYAGIEGVQVTLTGPEGELGEDDVLYRTDGNYVKGTSTTLGAGGAANVPSGLWSAETTVALAQGAPEHVMSADFQVPEGGVGVVHLFPTSSR